jgi:lipopolysaccharide assembly protein B
MSEMLTVVIIGLAALLIFYLMVVRTRRLKPAAPNPAQAEYFSGLSYLISGFKDKALEKFRNTVRFDTEYIDAYVKIGDILRDKDAADRAIKIHRDLLVRANLTVEQQISIHQSLMQDYRALKQWQPALETCNTIIQLDKSNTWALDDQTKIYEEMGDWQNAIDSLKHLDHVSKEDKKKRTAFYRLEQGLALVKEGKEHDGRIRFRDAIREYPDFLPPYMELVDSYMRDDRAKAALTILKKVINEKVAFPEMVFIRLKHVLFELGLYSEMESLYSDVLKEQPQLAEAMLGLAEIYEKKGQTREAADACRRVLANDPNRIDAKLMLLRLYLKMRDTAKANDMLAQIDTQVMTKQVLFRCSACGQRTDSYFHRCPYCQTWDSAKRS